jgi:RNA binding exosome subunit
MPCEECENGKVKWGKTGECQYDSIAECEEANKDYYEKTTSIVELVIADDSQELAIDAISLVTSPAIEQDFVYFGKEKNNLTFAKVDEEKRMLVSPALIPNKQIFRHDPNTDSDYYVYFSPDTVRKASELYLKHNNHHKATYQHQDRVSGVLTVESWIIEDTKLDKSTLYGYSLPVGTWMVKLSISNDEIWSKIKDGELKGLSIEGYFTNKFEQMNKKQPTTEQILSAFNELVREGKITTMSKANRIELGLTDDVEKLIQQAKDLIPDLTRDVDAIKTSEKNIVQAEKLIGKRESVVEKAFKKERELRRAFESAQDNLGTAERELKETQGTLESNKKSVDFLNKRLDKTKGKASKLRANLEKKTDKLEKAAKDLDVKIPATKEAAQILKKLISLL